MRPSLCRSCLASLLKLLNFLQTFVGVAVIIYSAWALSEWRRRGLPPDLDGLPAPWFVCVSMGVGVLLCLMAFIGHVAAEAISGCCLCFYAIWSMLFIALEAAIFGDLMLNKHWEEDLPYDATGEIERLQAFIEDNMDICKWVAAGVIVIQASSLVFAVLLRAIIPSRRVDYDSDEDLYVVRRPLLIPKGAPSSATTTAENKGFHSNTWSARLREKYGLNQAGFSYNPADPNASSIQP